MLVWCDSFRDSSIAIKAAASNAVRTFELHHQISSAQKLAIYQVGHNILGRIGYMRGEILSLQQELNALQSVQLNDISKKNIYRAVDGCKNGMNLLVKDLDDLKKLDPYGKLDKKPIDLPQLLERVVRSCASDLANDKIHEIVLNTFPAIIYGDYRKLSDAFIELVNNASKAIKRNLHHHQDHKVDITLTKDSKNYLSIIITDTGTGVSEDVRERIFLPYATTEGSNGSGMGLPIVKDIVEKHRGTVILDSTFRKGARFVVKFPPSIFNKPVEE